MKDGQYYSGVITVTRNDEVYIPDAMVAPNGSIHLFLNSQVAPSDDAPPPPKPQPEGDGGDPSDKGCRTKPMHLRVTAKGSFIGGLQVRCPLPRWLTCPGP